MKPRQSLLIVDDHQDNLDSLALAFARSDYDVATALGGREALKVMSDRWFDVIITDLKMPGVDGLELVKRARALNPPCAILVITAHGSIPTAVEALRDGAVEYLTKPVDLFALREAVAAAMEAQLKARQQVFLPGGEDEPEGFENMIGDSEPMRRVYEQIERAAASRATVLVVGESGTGKELMARALHHRSDRAKEPFVAVHCAAMAPGLVESELFGHERGAFTGAESARPGRFELATGGTLFLDEVSEIPPAAQVKLLRALENREFQRVGGAETLHCDARVIGATQRNLEEMVAEGTFREDLFYRLSVVTIQAPPLRDRPGDVELLARAFLREFSGQTPTRLSQEAFAALKAYEWPGNVRELRNVIERLCVMRHGEVAGLEDLPRSVRGEPEEDENVKLHVGMRLDEIEQTMIEDALRSAGGNRTKAAKLLGISRRTLQRKLGEASKDTDE